MINRKFKRILITLTVLMISPALLLSANAGDGKDDKKYHLYTPSTDADSQISKVLTKAKAEDKNALIVIGANWCHDSRSMAKKLTSPEMAQILSDHYVMDYIGVGYYDHAMHASQQFGLPIILGTPTVFIVDPKTGAVINSETVHKWRAAYSISMDETVEYFIKHASMDAPKSILSDAQKAAMLEIDAFELAMSKVIRNGFDRIGPQLKTYKETGKEVDSFDKDWGEVAKLRSKLTQDLKKLREQVLKSKNPRALILPTYPPFSWEKK